MKVGLSFLCDSNISQMNWTVVVDWGKKKVTSTPMSLLDELHYTRALVGGRGCIVHRRAATFAASSTFSKAQSQKRDSRCCKTRAK